MNEKLGQLEQSQIAMNAKLGALEEYIGHLSGFLQAVSPTVLAERLPSSMVSSKQALIVILPPIVVDMMNLEHAVLVDEVSQVVPTPVVFLESTTPTDDPALVALVQSRTDSNTDTHPTSRSSS